MRSTVLASLALPLGLLAAGEGVAAQPGSWQAGPVQASYTAYFSGLSVATLDASIDLGAEAYRVAATMRTTGMLAMIIRGEQVTLVEGRVQPGASPFGLAPSRFLTEGTWRSTLRRVAMGWTGGQPEVLSLQPAAQDEREPVPPELQRDTVDTLTALAALVRQAAATGRCDGAAQVFDGRRRSDFTAATEGMETLEAHRWGSFSGPALRCRFEGRQVAGFWKRGDREEAAKPRGGTAWLASPGPGLPMIPVRIEADSNWGTVFVHVTRAGPGMLALPARHSEAVAPR
jgi:hypothetical protein